MLPSITTCDRITRICNVRTSAHIVWMNDINACNFIVQNSHATIRLTFKKILTSRESQCFFLRKGNTRGNYLVEDVNHLRDVFLFIFSNLHSLIIIYLWDDCKIVCRIHLWDDLKAHLDFVSGVI